MDDIVKIYIIIFMILGLILYHAIFDIWYFNLGKALLAELIGALIFGAIMTAIALKYWWITVIIIVLLGFGMSSKVDNPGGKKIVLGSFIAIAVFTMITAISFGRSVENDDREESRHERVADEDSHNSTSNWHSSSSDRQSSTNVTNSHPSNNGTNAHTSNNNTSSHNLTNSPSYLDTINNTNSIPPTSNTSSNDSNSSTSSLSTTSDTNHQLSNSSVIPEGYITGYNYNDYKGWNGNYDKDYKSESLIILFYHDEKDYRCGQAKGHFNFGDLDGTLIYIGSNQFIWDTNNNNDQYILSLNITNSHNEINLSHNSKPCASFIIDKQSDNDNTNNDVISYNGVNLPYCIVTAPDGYVNFRTGPGTNYDIIISLSNGERLIVTGTDSINTSWISVIFFDTYGKQYDGWVNRTQVSFD